MGRGELFKLSIDTEAAIQSLKRISETALPRAVAGTLTATAADVQEASRKNIERDLIVRAPFTLSSIRYRQARGRNLRRMEARVGTMSSYMAIQEKGGTVRPSGAEAIPTLQARISRSKQRRKSRRYQLGRMGRFGPGSPFFILYPTGRGRLKDPGVFTRRGKRLIMLYLLSRKTRRVEPTHWLGEAVKDVANSRAMRRRFLRFARKNLQTRG